MKKLALSVLTSALLVGLVGCGADSIKDAQGGTADTNKQVTAQKTADAKKTEKASAANDLTFKEKVVVSLGTVYAQNLDKGLQEAKKYGFDLDKKALGEAFVNALNGKASITETEALDVLKEFDTQMRDKMEAKAKEEAAANLKLGEEFLAKNAKAEGVKVTESGLQYKIEKEGTGPKPKADDIVKVSYKGTNIAGEVFDESKEPVEFPLNGVIKGWTEGLQLVNVGTKLKLYVPAKLAYGEFSPTPAIKPNSVLIFDVELLEIVPKDKPADAKAQPKSEDTKAKAK